MSYRVPLRVLGSLAIVLALQSVPGQEGAHAQEPPQALGDAFIAAVNAGDVDGALATLAEDVRVASPDCLAVYGQAGCTNRAEFEAVLRAPPAQGLQVTPLSSETSGSTVTYSAEFRGGFIPPGFDRVLTVLKFEAPAGEVTRITLDLDPSDAETMAVVQALTGQMTPPSTGDAGLAATRPSPALCGLAVLSLAVAAGAAATLGRARRVTTDRRSRAGGA
jgi:hypothetical protein